MPGQVSAGASSQKIWRKATAGSSFQGHRLLAEINRRVTRQAPEKAAATVVRTLVGFASSLANPVPGVTSVDGGRGDARGQFADAAGAIVEAAHRRLPASAVVPDVPPSLICAVTCRLVVSRLRRGERELDDLANAILGWVAAYERPIAQRCWPTLAQLPLPDRSPFLPPTVLQPPPRRSERSPATRAAFGDDDWLRIVFATAELVRLDGYERTTVARIAAAAEIETRAFHRVFASKQEALAAANGLAFSRAMAAAAGAFVGAATWPERVWEAARALVQFADEHRTLVYASLLEAPWWARSGRGHCAADRAAAFTIFLQEGDRTADARVGSSFPRASGVVFDAVAAAGWELCYRHAYECRGTPMSAVLGRLTFIALAPFMGVAEASDIVHRQACRVEERGARPRSVSRR
jgi:AcrR family transcriptional regulator